MFVLVAILLMFLALAALALGYVFLLFSLAALSFFLGRLRHPATLLPLAAGGLWITATLAEEVWIEPPDWWVQAALAMTFAVFVVWPPEREVRPWAITGLIALIPSVLAQIWYAV